jgi:DNA-binding PadR family transcriptional regulator
MHGYEIRQVLERWGAAHWSSLSYGSIYHALATMAAEGLLDETGSEPGRGPDRRLYALTSRGREKFMALVRDHWWRYERPSDPMFTAIAFMDMLSREELIAALRSRAAGFRNALAQYPEWIRTKLEHAPQFVAESLRLGQAKDEAELRWVEDLIEKLEQGTLP